MTKRVAMFPGQGSQVVGMAKRAVRDSAAAAAFWQAASERIDTDLSKLCWESSDEELRPTQRQQPALVAASLATWIAHHELSDDAASEQPQWHTAGHSIGAIPAAAAAGYLDPVDAVHLAAERGKLMASAPAGGTMLAVVTAKQPDEDAQFRLAAELADAHDCDVAAVNGPTQVVLAGAIDNIARAEVEIEAKTKQLSVSNAFHSRFMHPVAEEWAALVTATDFQPGTGSYIGCRSGELCETEAEVRADIIEGLTMPVRWMRVLTRLIPGADAVHAFGPGRATARLARPYLGKQRVHQHEPQGAK